MTPEVTGQSGDAKRGPVKLFAWSAPQGSFPHDALRLHAADLSGLLVRAAAVDSAKAYQLFDLDRGGNVPLVVRKTSARARCFPPHGRCGRGATRSSRRTRACSEDVTSPTSGWCPPLHRDVDQLPAARCRPAVMDALLPLARDWWRWRSPRSCSARSGAAAGGEGALGSRLPALRRRGCVRGGGPAARVEPGALPRVLPRGGVLTVAYLGAGSAWLLLPKRGRDVLVGGLAVATVAAAVTVALAGVNAARWRRPRSADRLRTRTRRPRLPLGGRAELLRHALPRRRLPLFDPAAAGRVRANLWIGGGALVVALATGLSRADSYSLVYAGQLIGIALMFSGFAFVGKEPSRQPAASSTQSRVRIQPEGQARVAAPSNTGPPS